MIANLNPLYLAYDNPDVTRISGNDTFISYDFIENPRFFISTTRYLNDREIFEWDVVSVTDAFFDIIKNQVHVFPSLYVDFGLVLSQKEMNYYIWNSWTNKTAYIEEPVPVGDYGTTFVIDIGGNFTLQPGQGVPATLTVYSEGPISSYTNFEINVTPQGLDEIQYVIETKAARIVVFPFWPDWSNKVQFGLKFNTIISKSTQNYEQRRPLCEKPQRSIAFTNLDTTYGLINNAINFAQDKSVGIPILHEVFKVSSVDGDKMGFTIMENTGELWNLKRYCNYVLLFDKKRNILVAKKITSLTTNKILIENPILEDVSDTSSLIGFPMIIGIFKSAKPKVLNGNLVSWNLSLVELIGENQPELVGVGALPATLDNKFDWSQEVGFEKEIYHDLGEFPGTAQMVYSKYPLTKNPLKPYTGTFTFKTRAELFTFLDFICGAKGRFKKFDYLFPLNEFQLIQGEYEGVTQFRVRNNYYAEQFSKVLNKKVVIKYRNFSLSTTINSVSTNTDYTTITFANATNFRVYDEDYQNVRIEQWKTVRFDLDDFTVECTSGKSFVVKIRFMEVYE